jgi:hypothetical protein
MEGHPPIQLPPGSFKFGCAGAAVLLARICRELRIQQLVNAMVKYDVKQCKVSPGTLVVAMIINLLWRIVFTTTFSCIGCIHTH